MTAKQLDYQTLNNELDEVLRELQRPDIAVDEAVKLYEKGMKLIDQLTHHVEQAENKLEKVRLAMGQATEG